MINKNTEPSQGEGVAPPPAPVDTSSRSQSHGGNQVYKSGPLFLSSKGIGWTSWKKRWFILTRTSLVFFRSDPNAIPQKANEVNLTLGGIDLNSSASVVVKEDKKLLTVLFPDGRDGRAFTLKAETSEDLHEWKAALEKALSEAPGAANVSEQNRIIKDDNKTDHSDSFLEQSKDRQLPRSLVIGRPILLALEDIDGNPSFLEKALRFIEEHGVKVEGILRQAADVELVECRIREYEHGESEFSADEDAHVIADCIKYFLRELPSHPVPASCCNALLEAYLKSLGADRNMKVNAMRTAICETFPEPNRCLLQRILVMMQTVASHKSNNRMSPSAVAACMAPLLLRPLLAGDCELEHGFDIGSDNSLQLMKAAAAANRAQTIVITLLEEYNNIFGEEGSVSPGLYSYSEDSESDFTEDDESFEDDDDYYESEGSDADHDDDSEYPSSESCSENGGETGEKHQKSSEGSSPGSKSHEADNSFKVDQALSSSAETMLPQQNNMEGIEKHLSLDNRGMKVWTSKSNELHADDIMESSLILGSTGKGSSATSTVVNGPMSSVRPATAWGPTPAKKLSMESTDPLEDEAEIGRLEIAKADLQNKIAEEVKKNATLHQDLEKHKNALHERRLALEQDVARLQEQLQKEGELRTVEAGFKMPQGPFPVPASIDEKTKADIGEIAQAEEDAINLNQNAIDLGVQLKQELEQNNSLVDSCNQPQQMQNQHERRKAREKNSERAAAVESTRSKDSHVDKTDCRSYVKQEPASSPNKFPPQNVLSNPICNSNTSAESGAVKLGPSNSKKSSTKGEGSNFALSKLTNRLNFLKERRNQIATELQNIVEKGKNAGQSNQNVEKVKGSEPC